MPESTESRTPCHHKLSQKKQRWIDEYFLCGMNQTEASRRMGYQAPEQHGWRMSKNVDIRAAIKERLYQLQICANEVLFRIQDRARATAADWLTFREHQHRDKVWVRAAEAIRQLREDIQVESIVAARLELSGDEMKEVDKILDHIERRIVRLEVRSERDPATMVLIEGPLVTEIAADFDLPALQAAGKLHLIKSTKRDKDGAFRVELYDAHAADVDLGKHLGLFGAKGTKDDPKYVNVTGFNFGDPDETSSPDAKD